MTAAELLAARAVDARGRSLGKVHDIAMARSGEGEPWHIEAVVVGPSALAYRLGYATGEVGGPALLTHAARWLTRRSRRIPWPEVISFDGTRLLVRTADDNGRERP